jgi:UDP-N-acetylglucosamine--N-acetylmuramyl-(pentapeptide) pyrophosphoryl-undecaprenol N-acetylglucosamine transferase
MEAQAFGCLWGFWGFWMDAGNDIIKVMVVASGTAGHILPSQELIKELLDRGYHVDWLGYKNSLEIQLQHKNLKHFQVFTHSPRTFSRVFSLMFYQNLLKDIRMVIGLLKKNQYLFVLLTGGFVGFIPGFFAVLFRKQIVVYEQNVIFGSANAWIAPFAKKVFFGLKPLTLPNHGVYIGQPLRPNIVNLKRSEFPERQQLMILGGSLGASFFNEELLNLLISIKELKSWKIVHFCGARANPNKLKSIYENAGLDAEVLCYVEAIEYYYQSTTRVIARAGAMTIAELMFLGIPTYLIPLPNAAGNHQVKNALTLSNYKNFTVCFQKSVSTESLINFLQHSCDNAKMQYHNPTVEIINQCLTLSIN